MLGFMWSDGGPNCELDFPDFEFWHADRETSKAEGRRVLAKLRSRADERDWIAFGHPDPHEVGAGRHPGGQWIIHGKE